jgi:2-octaprenyl-6-methoxyphenol hydroxylase
MAETSYDVVIAGAGMAGATFGLACAHAGLRAVLVDPMPFETQIAPSFDGRASAIAYSSFRQWRVLKVAERLVPVACPINSILVTDGRSPGPASGAPTPFFLRFEAAEIADRSEGEPLGWMVENRHTRAALAETILEAGVETIAPAAIVAVERDGGLARARLSDGRVLSAPLVVGAEGRRSVVREAAGVGVVGWDYGQCGVVATVRMAEPHGSTAHEYFLPGGPFAILPLTENRASLVWTEPKRKAEALRTASDPAFLAHLRRRFGEFLGTIEVLGPRFVYPLSLGLAERMTAPRLALLGDSAHGVHPIAGQGLNLGLKDAAALAEVLVEAARLGEDLGSEAVLERYARWRRFDNTMLAVGTDLFVWMFSNDIAPLRAVRGLGLSLVNRIGPARRFFMQEAGGAVGDLPRLLRGEAL